MFKETAEEMAVEGVRDEVEKVLLDQFGTDTISGASRFRGMLSTVPSRVHPRINGETLYSMCGTFTDDVGRNLALSGRDVEVCTSDHRDSNAHLYLTTREGGVEVIIDPSIGQFIEGHNHVFVGTRRQLQDLVLNRTGPDKEFRIIHTKSRNNPQEVFERTWGSNPRLKMSVEQLKNSALTLKKLK